MELYNSLKNRNSVKPIPHIPKAVKPKIDNTDDEIEFKALTSGLGFNKKKNTMKSVSPIISSYKEILDPINQRKISEYNQFQFDLREELHAFYGAPVSSSKEQKEMEQGVSEMLEVRQAPVAVNMGHRLGAFFTDLFFVGLVTMGSFFLIHAFFILFTGTDMLPYNFVSLSVFGALFLFYFIVYFTISERFDGNTVGKRLLGLGLGVKDGEPTLVKSFTRACVGLAGLLFIGFPQILGLDEVLSNTKVIVK